MINIDKDKFIEICNNSKTMAQACSILGLHFNTFKRMAIKLGCYKTNQGGDGIRKPRKTIGILTSEILEGKYPSYQTFKLKRRLLAEGIKTNECEVCGLSNIWNGKQIYMELEHRDGNRHNHNLNNLLMICPNCHSQTETYRAKNISKKSSFRANL